MGDKITGIHAIEEALPNAPAGSVLYVCRSSGSKVARLEDLARANGKTAVRKVAKIELDRLSGTQDHRGAMLETPRSKPFDGGSTSKGTLVQVKDFLRSLDNEASALVLLLDGITDPQNLGAILRSADQFSVDLVIVPERRSAQANETVARVSSGASIYVPMAVVSNLVREIETLQQSGFWVYGADMGGSELPKVVFPKRTAIVMGAEGSGLGQLVGKRCDMLVSIPTSGHIDSLNVSVATGILLYEFRRQQK